MNQKSNVYWQLTSKSLQATVRRISTTLCHLLHQINIHPLVNSNNHEHQVRIYEINIHQTFRTQKIHQSTATTKNIRCGLFVKANPWNENNKVSTLYHQALLTAQSSMGVGLVSSSRRDLSWNLFTGCDCQAKNANTVTGPLMENLWMRSEAQRRQ